MCWNENISLNTFLFSSFVLLLIIYNNTFTQYKIQELNYPWIYVFLASFILMQLIEFFLWRNIRNPFYNRIFSILGTCLIFLQPAASIMIILNESLRNLLLIIYSSIAIPYLLYNLFTNKTHTTVSKSGHLEWFFFNTDDASINLFNQKISIISFLFTLVWMFFFMFSFIYEKKWFFLFFIPITLTFSLVKYWNDGTHWSMWCWFVNSMMIYYVAYLLLYLPFLEMGSFC